MNLSTTLLVTLQFIMQFMIYECVSGLRINFITIMMGDNPSFGHAIQGPALDVAFAHALQMYPVALRNATRTTIYRKGMLSCDDSSAMIPIIASEIDGLVRKFDGFTVLIITGCSAEVLALGDYAREWNVPIISTIGSDENLANRQRYPTLLTFGPGSYVSRTRALVKILELYHWTTISLLCDSLAGHDLYPRMTCFTLLATLDKSIYMVHVQRFDSGPANRSSDVTHTAVLKTAAKESRGDRILLFLTVIIIASDAVKVRGFMIAAHKLNMTNGDYVYLAPVPTKVPYSGEMTWEAFDKEDEEARSAYGSLMFVNNPNADWDHIKDLLKEMADRSATKAYNYTLNSETYRNDLAFIAYEAMACVTMVLNESLGSAAPEAPAPVLTLATDDFRSRFLSRTFSIPSRSVTIQANGLRATDLLLSRLNKTSGKMETAWRYFTVEDQLRSVSELTESWPNRSSAPPDHPACGFQNDLCLHAANQLASPLAIALFALLGVLVASSTLIWLKLRRESALAASVWWKLDYGLVSALQRGSLHWSQFSRPTLKAT